MKNVIIALKIALKNDTLRHFFNATCVQKWTAMALFLTLLDRFKNDIFYERKRMKKLVLFWRTFKKNKMHAYEMSYKCQLYPIHTVATYIFIHSCHTYPQSFRITQWIQLGDLIYWISIKLSVSNLNLATNIIRKIGTNRYRDTNWNRQIFTWLEGNQRRWVKFEFSTENLRLLRLC
jgi:hypothetical protein